METAPEKPKKRSRGIYLLPNLFTTATLFAGFYAILAAMNDRFEAAAIAIFVAMLMDGLDGRVARMTNTQTAFGAEYDSLADMVAFGLAPSLVIYLWALTDLGKLGWISAFVYTAGTALRLARFNTQIGVADKRYFQGLPSPSAAAIIAGSVWLGVDYGIAGGAVEWLVAPLTIVVGLLMVSNVRYNSFKEIDFHGKVPFIVLVVVMLGFAILLAKPPVVLFLIFFVYAISGPVMTLSQLREWRSRRTAGAEGEVAEPQKPEKKG
ncbi:CDP-diacylglycerol--serine O-phosphatidyltransferase [Candidatus Endoriftia persephone str. Guaymas]|jgi:CDP-diacylglycerol--serine O-phosphatidyltransferase|uniref:CDP-diacylglycerol--serine O-phosphatidyltransferase n=3 Tax=Gammaproteobacteria TaxID=1236 RepID=G2FFN0_9GAMM|nr:CDP-diacylglycerol--serine O-phosphatidyltransferase [Candidatus Endoriftia persephone]EGV52220.1 CDP-diacylglycerol--serine O-phosphatidyltransferase [endosymbiont of Riftia pachyptila (vent Ph05)]EGW54446.1 CDP-diacylglycerol--serine O-phosphatidyltransferase [endosymbiont of Tevnia jerichonana (vent Tica)]MBA1332784.1 CDP-diacylglycerol--serine O-phosphatidyltransferase [Candidatus Endoriftia persephone str. Guaymas]USF87182.1 CDP-diacylglycerol--serine O-phosphatidyltransferase [Candidat